MSLKTLAKGFTGINNKIDPMRHRYDPESGMGELKKAVDCDIDDTGMISRRNGQTIMDARPGNVFCDKGDCFAVLDRTSDAAIYLVDSGLNLTGVDSGLTKGARVGFCQVGARTYFSSLYDNGYFEGGISNPWPVELYVGSATNRKFYPAPLGNKLTTHQGGRMFIARGKEIWISEPYAFGLFRMSAMYIPMASDIRMIKSVPGGLWLSDSNKVGFVHNSDTIEAMKFIKKASFPAHEFSENIELVDLSNSALQLPGLSAVWSSDEGLCVGSESGEFFVTTRDKLNYSAGTTGATVVDGHNVINTVY